MASKFSLPADAVARMKMFVESQKANHGNKSVADSSHHS